MFEDKKKKHREMDEYNEYSSMFYYLLKKVSNQISLTNCLFVLFFSPS